MPLMAHRDVVGTYGGGSLRRVLSVTFVVSGIAINSIMINLKEPIVSFK